MADTHPCGRCGVPLLDAPKRFPRLPERKWCDACRPQVLHEQYRASYRRHRAKRTAESRAWQAANPERFRESRRAWIAGRTAEQRAHHRAGNLRRKYGLTPDEYEAMEASQGGVCAICGERETRKGRAGRALPLCVDHDHETGEVRGLLCARCNSALGWLESPGRHEAALAYLRSASGRVRKVA